MKSDADAVEYRTRDLLLAAFLLHSGARLLRVDIFSTQERASDFVLSGVTDEALDGFVNNDPVPIRSFIVCFRELKTALGLASSRRRR